MGVQYPDTIHPVSDSLLPWVEGLDPALECLAADIRSELHREPDSGDLLLVLLLSSDHTIAGRALREQIGEMDLLAHRVNALRAERAAQGQQVKNELEGLTDAKEEAIAAREFDRAGDLHIEERERHRQQRRLDSVFINLTIDTVRRALGIRRRTAEEI